MCFVQWKCTEFNPLVLWDADILVTTLRKDSRFAWPWLKLCSPVPKNRLHHTGAHLSQCESDVRDFLHDNLQVPNITWRIFWLQKVKKKLKKFNLYFIGQKNTFYQNAVWLTFFFSSLSKWIGLCIHWQCFFFANPARCSCGKWHTDDSLLPWKGISLFKSQRSTWIDSQNKTLTTNISVFN